MSDEQLPTPEAEAPATKTYTQEEVEALTSGLKTKVDELLNEKKTAAQRAKEAEAEAIRVQQEAAKSSGKLEEFEKSLRGEFSKKEAELTGKLESLSARVTGESKKAILGSFAGDFNNTESVAVISQLVSTTFDGSDVKTEFKDFDGKVITTDPAEFKKWMGNHPVISQLMKADAASGGGATGSKNNGGGAAKVMKRNEFDKLNPHAQKQYMSQGGTLTE